MLMMVVVKMNGLFNSQNIANRLYTLESAFPGSKQQQNGYKMAAVLLPLIYYQDQWFVLYTKRTETLYHHKGQISFPGGMAEAGDRTPLDTALRETEEELGVLRSEIRLLGRLDDFYTLDHMLIFPFVGIINWPQTFNLSKDEVSKIILIPLDWLNDPDHSVEKDYNGHPDVVFYQVFEGEILWGITARMTKMFLKMLE
jgi:8-oxo-dGTP pyrophosphatase MutT (NUDIX family)